MIDNLLMSNPLLRGFIKQAEIAFGNNIEKAILLTVDSFMEKLLQDPGLSAIAEDELYRKVGEVLCGIAKEAVVNARLRVHATRLAKK